MKTPNLLILLSLLTITLSASGSKVIYIAQGAQNFTTGTEPYPLGLENTPFRVNNSNNLNTVLQAQIRDAADPASEVYFYPGTYNVEGDAITFYDNCRYTALGPGVNFSRPTTSEFIYAIIYSLPYQKETEASSVEHLGGIIIDGIAVNGNENSRAGIQLHGDNNVVRNCTVRGIASQTTDECFSILLTTKVRYASMDRTIGTNHLSCKGNLVENCVAYLGQNIYFGGHVGIAGGGDPSIADGVVRYCKVYGDPLHPSTETCGVVAQVTENCYVQDVGRGTYIEGGAGGSAGEIVVRKNVYKNCIYSGIFARLITRHSAVINKLVIQDNDIEMHDGGYGIFAIKNSSADGTISSAWIDGNRISVIPPGANPCWINLYGIPKFFLRKNTYPNGASHFVASCSGWIGHNYWSNGVNRTLEKRITSPGDLTDQLAEQATPTQ
jgi:hypothetical protein